MHRPEPRGYCNRKWLGKLQAGRLSERERSAILDAPCGMKNPLECKIHAAAVIGRQWDTAERRLLG